MPTFANDYLALRALHTRLTTVFTVTNAATYADFGRVDVVLARSEDTLIEQSGHPCIVIDQQDGTRSEWSDPGTEYRKVTALVACQADDSSGAQSGTANPITSPELLSRDLVTEIKTNIVTWFNLGLMGIEIQADKAIMPTGDDIPAGMTIIPHRVTFHYEVS